MNRQLIAGLVLVTTVFAPLALLAQGAADGPRAGKYLILSYGAVGKPPLNLGYVMIEKGGVYKVFLPGDKLVGEGKFEFDAAKKAVVWKSGPYEKEAGWGGAFEIDREGKTHKIRLKRTTIATNSTDS